MFAFLSCQQGKLPDNIFAFKRVFLAKIEMEIHATFSERRQKEFLLMKEHRVNQNQADGCHLDPKRNVDFHFQLDLFSVDLPLKEANFLSGSFWATEILKAKEENQFCTNVVAHL